LIHKLSISIVILLVIQELEFWLSRRFRFLNEKLGLPFAIGAIFSFQKGEDAGLAKIPILESRAVHIAINLCTVNSFTLKLPFYF